MKCRMRCTILGLAATASMLILSACKVGDLAMRKGLDDLGYSWKQVAVFRGVSTTPGDDYGCSVAISGNWAAVGCCGESGTGTVYLYKNINGSWAYKQTLTGTSAGGFFGVSVAISGNYLIVGAPGEGLTNRGDAHVYTLSSGTWGSGITLNAPGGGGANDKMGFAVAINDQWAFVGVPYAATAAGQVYVFYRGAGPWANSTPATLTKAPTVASGDYFGWSISLSGSHAVIGCPQGIGSGGKGAAYVFDLVGLYWGDGSNHPTTALTNSGTTVFGTSVAISGDTLVIGSPGNESAYIYSRSGTTWNGKRILDPNGSSGDLYGMSVGISENHVVVGATQDMDNGVGRGNAFPFESNGSDWNIESIPPPTDSILYGQLGNAAAISGDYAIVAADDGGGASIVGAVYIFERTK